jgi:hypothetical protein
VLLLLGLLLLLVLSMDVLLAGLLERLVVVLLLLLLLPCMVVVVVVMKIVAGDAVSRGVVVILSPSPLILARSSCTQSFFGGERWLNEVSRPGACATPQTSVLKIAPTGLQSQRF